MQKLSRKAPWYRFLFERQSLNYLLAKQLPYSLVATQSPKSKYPHSARAGGAQNDFSLVESHQAASPLVRLVKAKERQWSPSHLQGVLHQNWGGNELNRTVTCIVLKASANNRRVHLASYHDEFRSLGSDSVAIRWHKKQQQQFQSDGYNVDVEKPLKYILK
ncbi:hypothetical protein TNCV_3519631 [Trichonephila clavipes]|uniref:Uncharacterized protein n=1 Tax=Trichonephila clavipes TaxID=2585209 RepID=A0A8X6STW1_TRICX|nr:hypothetical protein TNCV_3519631 [Trichonephila clavipes]